MTPLVALSGYSNHDHDKKGMADTRTLDEVRKGQRAPTQMLNRQYLRKSLPLAIWVAADLEIRCKGRAAGLTLASKLGLPCRTAQASSRVLGPASTIFKKKATEKLRVSRQFAHTFFDQLCPNDAETRARLEVGDRGAGLPLSTPPPPVREVGPWHVQPVPQLLFVLVYQQALP